MWPFYNYCQFLEMTTLDLEVLPSPTVADSMDSASLSSPHTPSVCSWLVFTHWSSFNSLEKTEQTEAWWERDIEVCKPSAVGYRYKQPNKVMENIERGVYPVRGTRMTRSRRVCKSHVFHYLIGERGRELCNTLMRNVSMAKRTVSNIIVKLMKIVLLKSTRLLFCKRSDTEMYKYVSDLRRLASTCNFSVLQDSITRDRVVCGTHSTGLRERLLRDGWSNFG